MCGGVVAHGGFADAGVDDGVDFVADVDRLLRDDLVRAHALHRVIRAGHLGDDGVVIVGVEPAAIADLASGFGVEGRVIENDFAFVAGLEFFCALAAFQERKNFAALGARLAVAFEDRRRAASDIRDWRSAWRRLSRKLSPAGAALPSRHRSRA